MSGLGEHPLPLGLATSCDAGGSGRGVIAIVTLLAHGFQVRVAAILNRLGKVRTGQGDAAVPGARVLMAVSGLAPAAMVEAAFALAFAPPTGALKADARAYLGPFRRVSFCVLFSYWHGSFADQSAVPFAELQGVHAGTMLDATCRPSRARALT